MSTRQQHGDYARKSTETARRIYKQDHHNAGEVLWGALMEALQYQSHRVDDKDHFKSPKRAIRIIESLRLNKRNLDIRLDQLNKAATILHGGFYKKDSVQPATHRRTFQRTQDLIRLLLEE